MASSESLPTPNTHESLRVVTTLALGAPDDALLLAVAPIAPDPLIPDVSTPVKLTTVMEDRTALDSVAVTEMFDNGDGANARQISDVPRWAAVRTTSSQVSPPPLTLVTNASLPPARDVATNANSSSFAAVVENVGEAAIALLVVAFRDTVTSMPIAAHAGVAKNVSSAAARNLRARRHLSARAEQFVRSPIMKQHLVCQRVRNWVGFLV
jgi:hypothetical protein